jgi:hypothetical protein
VIDSTTLQRLQALVRRESQSVLMYVDQAFPWTSLENEDALGRLQKIIRAEGEAIAEVGRFLLKQKANLPYLGSFPASYTTINFLALDHILQRLIDSEKGSIEEMQADLGAIKEPHAHALVEKFLAIKRQHLSDLEGMANSLAQPVEA